MAKKLTQKQQELLSNLSAETLLDLVKTLMSSNDMVNNYVVREYLSSKADAVKAIEREYRKRARRRPVYDYWQSHTFFIELAQDIGDPLFQLSAQEPDAVFKLIRTLLQDVERLCEAHDTSSGSWFEYVSVLHQTWLKAACLLFKQQKLPNLGRHYVELYDSDDHFEASVLTDDLHLLGHQALQVIRDYLCLLDGEERYRNEAIVISIALKDLEFLAQHYQTKRFSNTPSLLKYAELLIDELLLDQAVEVLTLCNDNNQFNRVEREQGNRLLLRVYQEEGNAAEAKALCRACFAKTASVFYYTEYLKLAPQQSEAERQDFLQLARTHGEGYYIKLLLELGEGKVLDQLLLELQTQQADSWYEQYKSQLSVSLLRRETSKLAKLGFAVSAVILRRVLVANVLKNALSQYYQYAVSDLKKSFDYAKALPADSTLESQQAFLQRIYAQHYRKHSFWQRCLETLPQIDHMLTKSA
ncbi:DUF6880 family protein [Testudinibacter aquarius]|uniref:Uncharacterized protein n=1 Tax=Testudinibacter aquarius TaxID=1524974 RepID=A0A4R3YDJ4_9PAST|nr:DUF6880 family protein [Testudinibacter aquarius]KAE9531080.1 hypothetical protein A1D24_05385 [Testudinibacter aquarius]TCV89188.1 hypothetical protein EDC16_10264 [Testudinibacter aquarius]TNG91947.1 hypothetical protein FHQ21_06190 [Testudinibacter aquarius]